MADYMDEARSHFENTIGIYQGEVIQLERIVYDDTHTGIPLSRLHRHMTYEESKQLMQVSYRLHGKPQRQKILLSEIQFPFPESKLINATERKRPKAIFINRYSYRQWRRGLRNEMLHKLYPNMWLFKQLGFNSLSHKRLSWEEIEEFVNPTYYNPIEVIEQVKELPGTYAVSPDFWVGLGRSGIVFGYHQYTVGKVLEDDNIRFELHAEAQDLYEQLTELVGGNRASIAGHWISQRVNEV